MELFEDLRTLGSTRRYRAGEHVLHPSRAYTGIVALASGFCKVLDVDLDGHEAIMAIRGPGDVFGEIAALTGGPRTATVVALDRVEAVLVDLPAFDAYLDGSPRAGRRLATMLAHRVAEANRPALTAGRKVEVRVADRLAWLAERWGDRHGEGVRFHCPLSHGELASWIGATRAVTTRAMGTLRDRGLIDFGRGWVEVRDLAGLRAMHLLDD